MNRTNLPELTLDRRIRAETFARNAFVCKLGLLERGRERRREQPLCTRTSRSQTHVPLIITTSLSETGKDPLPTASLICDLRSQSDVIALRMRFSASRAPRKPQVSPHCMTLRKPQWSPAHTAGVPHFRSSPHPNRKRHDGRLGRRLDTFMSGDVLGLPISPDTFISEDVW